VTAPLRLRPDRGLVRGVRAGVLTVPTVGGAALAHSFVDGCDSAVALALAVGLCWPAAVALLGAQRRLPALLAWVIAAQVATHVLLEQMCGDVTSGRVPLTTHLSAGVTPTMVLAHGVAVIATSVLLGRADAGLWAADALVRTAARALRLPRLSVGALPVARLTAQVADVPAPRTTWVVAQPARRGPPVQLAVAR
jgi:hypothetical protein